MKTRGLISRLISALLVFIVLISSSGITLVTHACHECGKISFTSESIFARNEILENCCEDVHPSDHNHPYTSISGSCCEHKVIEVKINNFVPENQTFVTTSSSQPLLRNSEIIFNKPDLNLSPVQIFNKHGGGRSVVTSNCQILS